MTTFERMTRELLKLVTKPKQKPKSNIIEMTEVAKDVWARKVG